jgi:thiol-disulfide isomerase/thioredoxin
VSGGRHTSAARGSLLTTLVAVVAATVAVSCGGSGSGGARELPTTALRSLDGSSEVVLAELEGPAVVNLWAVTCVPCRKELPALQAAADQHPEVRVVLVNNGDDPGPSAAFLAEIGVDLPAYQDPLAEVASALRVASLPATLFIAADGSSELHFGALEIDEIAIELASLS